MVSRDENEHIEWDLLTYETVAKENNEIQNEKKNKITNDFTVNRSFYIIENSIQCRYLCLL